MSLFLTVVQDVACVGTASLQRTDRHGSGVRAAVRGHLHISSRGSDSSSTMQPSALSNKVV